MTKILRRVGVKIIRSQRGVGGNGRVCRTARVFVCSRQIQTRAVGVGHEAQAGLQRPKITLIRSRAGGKQPRQSLRGRIIGRIQLKRGRQIICRRGIIAQRGLRGGRAEIKFVIVRVVFRRFRGGGGLRPGIAPPASALIKV